MYTRNKPENKLSSPFFPHATLKEEHQCKGLHQNRALGYILLSPSETPNSICASSLFSPWIISL